MKFPRLFSRSAPVIEEKASAAAQTIVMSPGQPVWTPRDYPTFSKEGYGQNAVVYAAVNKISDAVASVPWTAWNGETELVAHPAIDLLRRPNPQQSADEFIRAKIGYLMLAGNGYEELIRIGQQPREIYQLRPDRMRVIPSASGEPAAYQYEVNGRKTTWPADDNTIRHLRQFHPANDWYGQSPIEAIGTAIDTHNQAMAWLFALLQNSARPSGALVHTPADGAMLSAEQFQRLKAEIDQNYTGSRNAGRPMLLEGGLDWKAMGLSPSDMGIIETKNSAARDIALGLGVPPLLLNIPGDATYSNYQEARLAFWEDTVIPLLEMIAADWSDWFEVDLRPDLDNVPAIADKKSTVWDMVEKSTVLTINEKRERMGFQPIDGGDVLLVGMAQIPLDQATAPPQPLTMPDPLSPADMKAIAYGLETTK